MSDERTRMLEESQSSMHIAFEAAQIYFFEYFPDQNYAMEYSGREHFCLEERLDHYPESWFAKKITHPEDEAILMDAFQKIQNGGDRAACTVRNLMQGEYRWYKYNFTSIYEDKISRKRSHVVCTAQDVTDTMLLRQREAELQENNTMYRLTTEQANINLWKYDIVNDVMHNSDFAEHMHPGEKVISNFVNTVIRNGAIRKDSVEAFKETFDKLRAGEKTISNEFWIRKKDGTGWWCERVTYVNVLDEDGKPRTAFGIGRDITEIKDAERRIMEEEEFQKTMKNDRLLLRARCNITKGTVETLHVENDIDILGDTKVYQVLYAQIMESAMEEEDRDIIARELAGNCLMELTDRQKTRRFDYRRIDEQGHPAWVRVIAKTMQIPELEEVMTFLYIYDINHEKIMDLMMNRLVKDDYEVLALIYADSKMMYSIYLDDNVRLMSLDFQKKFPEGIGEFIEQFVDEENREEARYLFSLDHIKAQLTEHQPYEFTLGLTTPSGVSMRKKWKFYYFDEDKNTIIYSRMDITEAYEEQESQKQALLDALLQAEEASKAKTNFLSRMSHEIRTPMNAIIGMNALAAQNVSNTEQVQDCLAKVGISARFLLSLINDILDMSRIESGKMTLRKSKFPLEEMVNNINSIFYEQAEEKGIDYDCVISSYTSSYYIGDATKIQQIIVNLLGNSVKFTEPGGKIQLILNQGNVVNGRTMLTISVNDTGVGIQKDMLEKIFEPFEQADTSITTPYKGTGLGLAITKNLVNMMGGSIQVNSIADVGSEFVIRIPIEVAEEDQPYQALKLDLSLDKLQTLIVDDDITICEHTKQLLNSMGMKAEWVESGLRAVELIKFKWERKQYFDVVLLDWKMPDMDGIETAREIRKIVGDEVTIIVMTAYDWAEIEEEAKKAGVNLLVTKPLFRSSIVSVFQSAFSKKKEKERKLSAVEYDFTGKQILLVEDHILNVEVAKRLLESKHATVTVAENGLRSIEAFMQAEENFFDAILMDIRMPVMDGLTAARSIRALRKEGAESVPIIAMSANAFDEDIEKSKAAGMNEHLSKPIEPGILFAVLNKWFHAKQNL